MEKCRNNPCILTSHTWYPSPGGGWHSKIRHHRFFFIIIHRKLKSLNDLINHHHPSHHHAGNWKIFNQLTLLGYANIKVQLSLMWPALAFFVWMTNVTGSWHCNNCMSYDMKDNKMHKWNKRSKATISFISFLET